MAPLDAFPKAAVAEFWPEQRAALEAQVVSGWLQWLAAPFVAMFGATISAAVAAFFGVLRKST